MRRGAIPNRPSTPGALSRPGASGPAFRAPVTDPDNPYRSYDPAGSYSRASYTRMATGRAVAVDWDDTGLTSVRLETVQRKRHGFALFHDGNAGHLWRGEVASQFGDAILSVGVVMWVAYLTLSPWAVALAVVAMGLPWLLVGPLATPLQNLREPGAPLRWLGRLRALCALGFVALHFYTIYPAIFGLLFVIALIGRLREALRVAALRTCLEPGEPELVSNDLYIGSAISATLGPLLASALFIGLGERVILIGVAAAICYLLSSNSDGFLDALPEKRRAFLKATVTSATPDPEARDELLNVAQTNADDLPEGAITAHIEALARQGADPDAPETQEQAREQALAQRRRELALPEWYQQGPKNAGQALRELGAGVGLVGGAPQSAAAMINLCALAFVGGGLSVLEVFYLLDRLGLEIFYLGPLIAAEGAGMALGGALVSLFPLKQRALPPLLLGVGLSGVALAALGYARTPSIALGAALGLGLANTLAVTSGRRALRIGFNGVERRAIGEAETWLTALVSLLGAALFALFYAGAGSLAIPHLSALKKLPFTGFPIAAIFFLTGVGLVIVALCSLFMPLIWHASAATQDDIAAPEPPYLTTKARIPGQPAAATSAQTALGMQAASGTMGSVGALWEDNGVEDDVLDAADYGTGYESAYGEAYGDEMGDDDLDDDESDLPRGRPRNRW